MSGQNGHSHPKGDSWSKKGHGIQPNGAPGGCLLIALMLVGALLALLLAFGGAS